MAWPKDEHGRLTEEIVYGQLDLLGVVYGMRTDAITEFVHGVNTTDNLDQPYVQVITEGEAALDGIDGRIEWAAEENREVAGTVMPGGHIDFRERGSFVEVEAEDLIARVIGPTDPVPGRDIFGTELPAKKAKRVILKAGAGTRSTAPRSVRAAAPSCGATTPAARTE